MTPEQYRKYIAQMLDRIHDEKSLEQIYNYTHRRFIRAAIESEEEHA